MKNKHRRKKKTIDESIKEDLNVWNKENDDNDFDYLGEYIDDK